MGNAAWFNTFSEASAHFGTRGLSDHSPAILNTGFSIPFIKRPFQIFNFLFHTVGFTEVVQQAWDVPIYGHPLYILAEKLRRVKRGLIDLNKRVGNLTSNVKKIRMDLQTVQLEMSNNLTSELRTKERKCI